MHRRKFLSKNNFKKNITFTYFKNFMIMKKLISILAIGLFSLNYAQETPKEGGCCAGKDKKECSVKDKKACSDAHHKGCDAKTKTAENTSKIKDKKAAKVKKTA
ncbi:hypothetical protein CW752_11485 [Chryseobacterium sp. PMSZPI]|nr:hypothetical protein CW752_11485 [Chryseobacterium sp. PMSZPI]